MGVVMGSDAGKTRRKKNRKIASRNVGTPRFVKPRLAEESPPRSGPGLGDAVYRYSEMTSHIYGGNTIAIL